MTGGSEKATGSDAVLAVLKRAEHLASCPWIRSENPCDCGMHEADKVVRTYDKLVEAVREAVADHYDNRDMMRMTTVKKLEAVLKECGEA